jgi:hypothetical protein
LQPNAVVAGGVGFVLSVQGDDFSRENTIYWNASPRATSFISSKELRTSVSQSDIALASLVEISVRDEEGRGSFSNRLTFTINNPLPSISGLNPNSTEAGGSGFTLRVDGSNFVTGSIVRWNNSNRNTTYGSPSQLTASILASDIATAGQSSVVTVFTCARRRYF